MSDSAILNVGGRETALQPVFIFFPTVVSPDQRHSQFRTEALITCWKYQFVPPTGLGFRWMAGGYQYGAPTGLGF